MGERRRGREGERGGERERKRRGERWREGEEEKGREVERGRDNRDRHSLASTQRNIREQRQRVRACVFMCVNMQTPIYSTHTVIISRLGHCGSERRAASIQVCSGAVLPSAAAR